MSFIKFEENLMSELKENPLEDINSLLCKFQNDTEVNVELERIIYYGLLNDLSQFNNYYSKEMLNESVKYAKEKAGISEHPLMQFRYNWHLLKLEKKKYPYVKIVLELINSNENLKHIICKSIPLAWKVVGFTLTVGKSMRNIHKPIWELIKDILHHGDPLLLIYTLKEIDSFIEKCDSTKEQKEYISLQVEKLEKFLEENKEHDNLDRLYKEIINTTILDVKHYKEKAAAFLLHCAESNSNTTMKIKNSRDSLTLYRNLGVKDKEIKSLGVLEDAIKSFGTESQNKVSFNLDPGTMEQFDKLNESVYFIFSREFISIENRLSYLGSLITNSLGIIYRPFPNLENIEDVKKEFDSSIASIFDTVYLGENKVISSKNNELEAKRLCYNNHFDLCIIPAMEALYNDKNFNRACLNEHLISSEIVKKSDRVFLEEAVDHFFNGKYISFLCVVVPTLESLLRNIYEKHNGTTILVKNNNNELQNTVNLTDILKDEKVRESFSRDFISYLQYLLNDETSSENIRNNIAHRIKDENFYSHERSLIVLHLLLLLTTYFRD
ncbi:DUF4209 domain-containing protein [Bacillus sp. 4A_MP2]